MSRLNSRVFKKSSPNGKITTYLGKRDFVDHQTHIDPIDGVVLVDLDYLKERKVFAHVLAAFRYGREDLDVLGLTFRKDLYLASVQVYPKPTEEERPLTRLQERLIKKLGSNAYPFYFEVTAVNSPSSVTLQPAQGDTGKPCGVDYELKTYVAETMDEKPHKRNSVRLAIRKVTYAPDVPGPQPTAEAQKEFVVSPGALHLEATLDKEMYYHGESIEVNVTVANNSNRTVKKIRVSVRQYADICLFSTAQYKCPVACVEAETSEYGLPLKPSQKLTKVFCVKPLLDDNKDKRGLALDGKLKHEDTNLASSTLLNPNTDDKQKERESLGILVKYKVKVKLILANFAGDLSVELPFTLSHPKPVEPEPAPAPAPSQQTNKETNEVPVDTNLINFDAKNNDPNGRSDKYCVGRTLCLSATNEGSGTDMQQKLEDEDDDLIFEDFARLRLKGTEGDGTDA
ncbi:beta-arrestin-1-like [Lytechinus variegatus]|uniref:beta-arrestin-1-like n=1 Tax=Lytechinus variegatus TaxID=7654 RepID=UPI001BB0E2FD|nr:beta-arrestin-1-like [Lytechinus variegatus]